MIKRTCSIPDCPKPAKTRGWCGMHYTRWLHHGDPLKVLPVGRPKGKTGPYTTLGRRGKTLAEQFWPKVDQRGPDDCWPWLASTNMQGYGQIRVDRKTYLSSRVCLELTLGRPLDEGTIACHHCDNPPCCNPAHLYAGTKADNMRDYLERGPTR